MDYQQKDGLLTPFLPPHAFSFHVLLYLCSHHDIQVFCLFSTNCPLNENFHLHVFNDYSARDGIWSFNYAIYTMEWIMLRFQITWISERLEMKENKLNRKRRERNSKVQMHLRLFCSHHFYYRRKYTKQQPNKHHSFILHSPFNLCM